MHTATRWVDARETVTLAHEQTAVAAHLESQVVRFNDVWPLYRTPTGWVDLQASGCVVVERKRPGPIRRKEVTSLILCGYCYTLGEIRFRSDAGSADAVALAHRKVGDMARIGARAAW